MASKKNNYRGTNALRSEIILNQAEMIMTMENELKEEKTKNRKLRSKITQMILHMEKIKNLTEDIAQMERERNKNAKNKRKITEAGRYSEEEKRRSRSKGETKGKEGRERTEEASKESEGNADSSTSSSQSQT